MSRKILIVDDDKGIRSVISDFLTKHGFETATAENPAQMRAMLAEQAFDLIVLDVMMPHEDGLTALRSLGSDAPPVIMLSAVGTDVDRIVGLELGAEDYLPKPCNPRELLARIRTVLRRGAGHGAGGHAGASPSSDASGGNGPAGGPTSGLFFEGWCVDTDMRLVFAPDGRMISLTDGEFRLLLAFVEHPRRVLTRDQLLEWSRGDGSDHFDRAIDVQLSRLRRKLGETSVDGAPDLIRTVRNEGYMFVPTVTRR